MKHFRLHQVHEVDLYIEAISEEAALEQWSDTIRITLEDDQGEPIPPGTEGYEELEGSCIESTIEEVDEYGDRV